MVETKNLFQELQVLPPDALFGIKQKLNQDTRSLKVDLGMGAYRDNNGQPWILPSVAEAERAIHADPSYNHEYLNIGGLASLTENAAKVILGDSVSSDRIASVQSLSGTGALHISGKFLENSPETASKKIYLSDPTWVNHNQIYETCGFEIATYRYWEPTTKSFNFKGMLESIASAPRGSIFVLHACAHNPTGIDPTKEQWVSILEEIKKGDHLVIFDSAYQGFASGSLEDDAFAIRLAVTDILKEYPVLVCQSFAKNVGMYGERVGCFHLVLGVNSSGNKKAIVTHLAKITRSEVSNPPAYGAKIVSTILSSPELKNQWYADLVTMSSRIKEMRYSLRDKLVVLQTPGNWDHVVNQCGMFSYTGLSKDMVDRLGSEHAVYLAGSGRASLAGLNEGNVEYVAKAIDEVVRYFSGKSNL